MIAITQIIPLGTETSDAGVEKERDELISAMITVKNRFEAGEDLVIPKVVDAIIKAAGK